jgi:hypothetical protein
VTDLSTAEQIIHLEGGPLNGQAFEGCFLGRRLVWPDDRADGGDYLLTLVKSAGPSRMTLELDTAAAAIVTGPSVRAPGGMVRSAGISSSADGLTGFVDCGLAEAAHASTTLHHDHEGTR